MIQVVDRMVPSATRLVETIMTRSLTRPSPYSMIPMNPASRKNAVTTSMPMIGPMMGPVACANFPQLSPNSKVMTVPLTTPSAKPSAKMRFQNRKICR